MYRVELSKRALRDLRRIEHKSRKRLLALNANEQAGYLVERIIDRRDLEHAASTLPS
jgi:mRNA-degrading endonuclease RelE of RelBE toxin-antitoxin system